MQKKTAKRRSLRPLTLTLYLALSLPAAGYAAAETLALTLPAQPLGQALNALARESKRTLLVDASLVQHLKAPALHGSHPLEDALRKLLAGSGLQHQLTADGAIVIQRVPPRPAAKATALSTVTVTATRPPIEQPNEQLLDANELRIARGTGNADIFSGQPQLQMNNIRNEAGAMDVGVRNMQGEGRVPIVIDGALQSTHTGRGYMGASDRTYIDSDLISKARVNIGASRGAFSSGAVGGLVEVQTLEASDILKEGQQRGLLIKGSTQDNHQYPDVPADAIGQEYYLVQNKVSRGRFKNGSLTVAGAFRHGITETVLAYGKRRTGNYFAGRRGYDEYTIDKERSRPPPVLPGMEVVNTSFASDSLLAKFSLRPNSEQQLKLIYRNHRQNAGEVLSAYWHKNDEHLNFQPMPPGRRAMPQWPLGLANIHTLSTNYTFTSASNPLLNLSFGLWGSHGEMRQNNGLVSILDDQDPKFGDQYRHHFNNQRHGLNLINRATWDKLALTTGFASQHERMRPINSPKGRTPGARKADRYEQSLFTNLEWRANPFLVQTGVNLHQAKIRDHIGQRTLHFKPKLDWHARIQGPLSDWLQWHAATGMAHRNPSLHEGSASIEMYDYYPDFPLSAERVRRDEIGASAHFSEILGQKNSLRLRAVYFDNRAKGYITQALLPTKKFNLSHINYDLFRNRGTELRADFEQEGFFLQARAVLYRKPEVCSAAAAARARRSVATCNHMGFAWSLIPSRIQPQRKYVLTAGMKLTQVPLTFGARWRYHSGKENPRDWLKGTGASPIVDIPAGRMVDLFAEYQLSKDVRATLNIDNVTDRYTIDPGQLITMPVPGRTIRIGFEAKF